MPNEKVLVALSGGVDSAMTAVLLQRAGFAVTGIYFVMEPRKKKQATNVAELAKAIGIELVVKDISTEFQKQVIDYFVDAYKQNLTPNPCVICNALVKFQFLLKAADELGIEKVATGHYAKKIEKDGDVFLSKADDLTKDQSYFLYRLQAEKLKRVLFPLGEYRKEEIKKMAEHLALPIEEKESQDICFFLKDETLQQFLSKRLDQVAGNIVDEQGTTLGEHKGLAFYTQGQRSGLGLSGGPYYVIGKNVKSNNLIVSKNPKHNRLVDGIITISQTSWVSHKPIHGQEYTFRSRYKVKETSGKFVNENKDGSWAVELSQPQWAVAPGQSLVVYDQDIVIGGGIIN